jgi:DNA-binding XRE family transcriptional regulator
LVVKADELRAWREQTGYTQTEAAARFFKVTRTTVQNWESGVTPIPAAVETACDVWARRVRQEAAGYGPVTLIYSDGPMFRSPYGPQQRAQMLHQEPYAMNAQAIARVCELWGRPDFYNPFVVERGGRDLWNEMELGRAVAGDDKDAPTRVNLLRRCADAIRALAADARANISLTVWNGPATPTPSQRADRERRIEAIAAELDVLAVATPQGIVSYQQVEERFTALRGLGKSAANALVSDVAKAFVALDALPFDPS